MLHFLSSDIVDAIMVNWVHSYAHSFTHCLVPTGVTWLSFRSYDHWGDVTADQALAMCTLY